MHIRSSLTELITQTPAPIEVRSRFLLRLDEGSISRDENPHSHFCVYFAAYDPDKHRVFIGHHRKSGLWLFNGGHLDRNEDTYTALAREIKEEWGVPINKSRPLSPALLTITDIENPTKQPCRQHFDVWFFIPVDASTFAPKENLLQTEFYKWGWQSHEDALRCMTDRASISALHYIQCLFLGDE